MTVTASQLRANIYRLLDEVLESGVPLTIERKGKTLVIAPGQPASRLSRLTHRHDYLKCEPDDIVHMDWSGEWRP